MYISFFFKGFFISEFDHAGIITDEDAFVVFGVTFDVEVADSGGETVFELLAGEVGDFVGSGGEDVYVSTLVAFEVATG